MTLYQKSNNLLTGKIAAQIKGTVEKVCGTLLRAEVVLISSINRFQTASL